MVESLKKELGQVFTPKNIAELMASFLSNKIYRDILDPAAGNGALLDACFNLFDGRKTMKAIEIDNDLIEILSNKGFEALCMNFFDYNDKVDSIIMNPPYIRQELLTKENSKNDLLDKLNYKNITSRSNLYLYFLIKALETLREDGRVVVIIPNTWLTSAYGITIQKYILSNYTLNSVINFEKNVFDDVDVDVSIFVIDNLRPTDLTRTQFYYFEDIEIRDITELLQAKVNKEIPQKDILSVGWFFYKENISFNFDNITTLSDFAIINRGLTTNFNNFFIKENDEEIVKLYPNLFKKIVNKQTEIKTYLVDTDSLNKVVMLIPKELNQVPQKIILHIKKTEKLIKESKSPKSIYNMITKKKEWFSLKAQVKNSLIFNYIIRNDVRFIINNSSAVVKDNFYQITFFEENLQMIYFAILNSSFSRYFIEHAGRSYGSGLLKIQKYELDRLPILDHRMLNLKDRNKLIDKSKKLLANNSKKTILEIDKVLEKYYLDNGSMSLEEFYIVLDKQIKGRLNK